MFSETPGHVSGTHMSPRPAARFPDSPRGNIRAAAGPASCVTVGRLETMLETRRDRGVRRGASLWVEFLMRLQYVIYSETHSKKIERIILWVCCTPG